MMRMMMTLLRTDDGDVVEVRPGRAAALDEKLDKGGASARPNVTQQPPSSPSAR
jgi:hypothetical protein